MVSHFWTYGVAPRYLWLAQLGNTLAHELMHTFDINGWGFDENGEVAGWMTSDTRLRLTARIQCLVNQYAATFSHSVRLFGRSHSVDVSASSKYSHKMCWNRPSSCVKKIIIARLLNLRQWL